MISYYELLGMIKKGKIPNKIEYNYDVYTWDGKCYSVGYKFLADQLLEIEMFEQNIKIIEVLNEKEKI